MGLYLLRQGIRKSIGCQGCTIARMWCVCMYDDRLVRWFDGALLGYARSESGCWFEVHVFVLEYPMSRAWKWMTIVMDHCRRFEFVRVSCI